MIKSWNKVSLLLMCLACGDVAHNTRDSYAALSISDDEVGGNCEAGGLRIMTGLDNGDGGATASDGILELGEVDSIDYVCDDIPTIESPPIENFVLIDAKPYDPNGADSVHPVILSRAFYIMRYEVTQAQFESQLGVNPSYFKECGLDCPVESVRWVQALAYANALSEEHSLTPCYVIPSECDDGFDCPNLTFQTSGGVSVDTPYACEGYRLPTAAEWEHAARASTTSDVYGGDIEHTGSTPVDPVLDAIGWYRGNSDQTTHPVGKKQPNAWGLYDMLGNVYELIWDYYDPDYSPGAYPADPLGPLEGTVRMSRGGAWDEPGSSLRVYKQRGGTWANQTGFRLVRTDL